MSEKTRSAVIDIYANTYAVDTEWQGDDTCGVTITTLGQNHYRIEMDSYWSSEGRFSLEITADLDTAMRVFMAAAKADVEIEMGS